MPANPTHPDSAWDRLQSLVNKAQQALRQSQYQQVERTLKEAGQQLNSLLKKSVPGPTQGQKERLVQTYRQLILAANAHQTSTREQLQRVRKGKRTVAAYAQHNT